MSIFKDAPEFDSEKPFNTVFGEGDEKYSQNGYYYNAHFEAITKHPERPNHLSIRTLRAKQVRAAEAGQDSALSLPTVLPPRKGTKAPLLTLSDARKENVAAEQAETQAD
jgi:hypothetical protein